MPSMCADNNQPKQHRRWTEWALFAVAAVCLGVYGVQWYRHRTQQSSDLITGQVRNDLPAGDRIPLEPGSAQGMNVLVITMDTTRADHLGCYGNRGIRTPVIDTLASNGVLFANAFTPSPSTLPGHSSIFTGLYPYHHGARANGTFHVQPEQTTLAEMLKGNGYATAAFIAAYVLDERFGLGQGFDVYDDDLTQGVQYSDHSFRERPGQFITDSALEWIGTVKEQPFFAWTHYFDPHAPYLPPEPFRSQYAERLYDGEIAYVDFEIGRLLAGLAELGVLDNTMLVLAGDHGEGLGEHGEQTHSLLIYDATLHTPLIFTLPQLRSSGKVVDRQVCNVDIVPTVLDLLGIGATTAVDGVSLCRGPEARSAGIFIESLSPRVLHGWSPLFGIRTQDAKYIHAPRPEYYDLKRDPKELDNQLASHPEQVAKLAKELEGHIGKDLYGERALAQMVEMDEETTRKLAALGYIETGGDSLLDPKDMVPHWERIQAAEHGMAAGHFQEAIDEWEACLKEVPEDVWTLRLLSSAYIQKGNLDRAEELVERALALEKNEPGIYLMKGRIAQGRGRMGQAEEWFDQALKVDPKHAGVYVAKGSLYARLRMIDKAVECFEKAIEMDPGSTGPMAYNAMGRMRLDQMEFDQARDAFKKALELDALNGDAHNGLATILIEEDRLEEAEAELQMALRYIPNNMQVLATLAGLHNKRGDYQQGIALARRALSVNDRLPQALNNLGSALRNTGDLSGAANAFETALADHPNYVPSIINLAQVYLAMHQEEKMAELYQRALEINPTQPIALCNLGTYKVSRGRLEEGRELFQRAVEAAPDYALAHTHLGMLLLNEEQNAEALHHLERSLELDPDQPEHQRIEELVRAMREDGLRGKPTSPSAGPGAAP